MSEMPDVGEEEEAAVVAKPVKLCDICHEKESKYRCVRCPLVNCGVACATIHRATHPAEEPKPVTPVVESPAPIPTTSSKNLAGTVGGARAGNPFSVLQSSTELETLFTTYPRLRSQLRDIYAFTQPPPDGGMTSNQYYVPPTNFYHHSQRGRGNNGHRGGNRGGRGGHSNGKAGFDNDKGLQEAIKTYGRAKEEDGKAGEAIQDYVDLVMKLVAADGEDAAKAVEDEVTAENARLISQLLDGESY